MQNFEAGVLDEIIARRRLRLEQEQACMPEAELRRAAEARADFRDFSAALRAPGLQVIAELKKASPSHGLLKKEFRCGPIAQSYEQAGAAALSVLTEEDYFQGRLQDLQTARRVTALPVLRKDIILTPFQVYESVAAGADALLLIVAALSRQELRELLALVESLRISALVEVHSETEARRAVDVGARMIGVNNRDLRTLSVDLGTSFRVRPLIPARCLAVSESGIKTTLDLERLAGSGFDAVLIGEHLMTAEDPGVELARLLGVRTPTAR